MRWWVLQWCQAIWATLQPCPTPTPMPSHLPDMPITEDQERKYLSAPYRKEGKPPRWHLHYLKAPLLSFSALHHFPVPQTPSPSLSPVESLLSILITYRIKGKPIYLFDIHHSQQPEANPTSHRLHHKRLFFLSIFGAFDTKRVLFKERINACMIHETS